MAEEPHPDDIQVASVDKRMCYCPVGGVINLLSKRHSIPVICAVGALQPVRYSDIEDNFGEVSSSTLSNRLNELTESGILKREQFNTIPPQVEYTLTTDGEELCELLNPLLRWVEKRDNL